VEAGLGARNGNELRLVTASLAESAEFEALMKKVREYVL
jgi:hypothetical protein